MSQANTSALRRIEQDLFLDTVRTKLGIPTDVDRVTRLLVRRRELEAERDAERREWVAALERHAPRETPVPEDVPLLAPMGPDETVSECERRTYFGDPPRTLPKWL
jgi:hypothetical protein